MKAVSFFAGAGGIDIGFKQAGFDVIFANEIDEYASKSYKLNFEDELVTRDINKLIMKEIPKHDVLLAGFPCQAFSIAGYRKGFEDERGELFFSVLKIIKNKKPKAIFLENVKNLVSHDGGNTFKVIIDALEANGYYAKYKVINAKDYGDLPQNRERIYIVAFSSKRACEKFKFPEPIKMKKTVYDVIDFVNKVDDKYYLSEKNFKHIEKLRAEATEEGVIYQWRRQYVRENKSGVVPTLTANMGMGGHNVPIILTQYGLRKLTPHECFNVQGYPEDYKIDSSQADSRLYKQAGNSVAVPVIKRIALEINKVLN